MRAIEFRGMDIKGHWYYGNLSALKQKVGHVEAGTYISNSAGLPFAYQVRPETVGQYTGLTDKNGKQIFEGDILLYPDTESEYVNVEVGNVKVAEAEVNSFFPVEFCDGEFGMHIDNSEITTKGWYSLKTLFDDYVPREDFEIIGNIYENPELLANPT